MPSLYTMKILDSLKKIHSMNVVFIIARPRSGTSALRDMLKQSASAAILPEIFHNDYLDNENFFFNYYLKEISKDPELALPSPENRAKLLLGYFDYLKHRFSKGKRKKKVLSVTVNYNSLHCLNTYWQNSHEVPYLLRLIEKFNFKAIHLVRENLLATLISEERARQSGIWHLTKDGARDTRPSKVRIDTATLVNELEERRREIRMIDDFLSARMPDRRLLVTYESLFPTDKNLPSADVLDKIRLFAGVNETLAPETRFVRTAAKSFSESVENFQDVANTLSSTEYSQFAR